MTPETLGASLPLWSAIPFAGLLLSIALLPLAAPRFWHRHYAKVALGWAALFAVPFLKIRGDLAATFLLRILAEDYLPFLILLGALFVVAGGLLVRGRLSGTPWTNTSLLGCGTLLASLIGTTGASMILIRPLLRANADRRRRVHTFVFFIFLVSNIGGLLTPLGDPPLFLGFLRGVPFFWTLRLLPELLVAAGILLVLHHLMDRRAWKLDRAAAAAAAEDTLFEPQPLSAIDRPGLEGTINVLLLGGIVGSVLLSGIWSPGEVEIAGMHLGIQDLVRDALLIVIALLSLALTPGGVRTANGFTWMPIKEVAWLFLGIFVTIVPALAMLRAGADGPMAPLTQSVTTPVRYFWATGILSSFLDNAPTYLAFLSGALGHHVPGLTGPEAVRTLLTFRPDVLAAISCGAVFMGANTYVGNAPNFMVRSIAQEAGVPMPSFFRYIFVWTIPILIPLFLLISLLFRGA